ncbi:hypothetical protein [Achromobacter insolitus]|uniref:hypothetical protein n=1 Tax=Achromobacter insolitus TaxID=217204 RepID=UPI0020A2A7F2|nr:hypothetical protein [Achromobacter insolitus]MCP1404590.1 glycerol uptake facilitator-like aquaporin [Achromobacter insolitus]
MIEYCAVGGLFLVLGFGLGQLRMNAVKRGIRKSRKPQGGRAHTVLLDQNVAIEIWKQTFSESSEIARDFFKWLIGSASAGLAATGALFAVKGNTHPVQLAAVAFALLLLVAALPTARMTNRFNNKAQDLGARIASTPKGRRVSVSLPYVWEPGKQTWVEFFAIIVLGAAIVAFMHALAA